MTASVREQIIEAVLAALTTGAPVGVPQATRRRGEPYQASELPAIDVKPVREEVEYEQSGKRTYFRKRVLTLRVSVSTIGDDSVADPMTTWATQVLDGQNVAPSLIEDCIEALYEWDFSNEDQKYSVVHQDFRIHYHTVVGDQTRAQ